MTALRKLQDEKILSELNIFVGSESFNNNKSILANFIHQITQSINEDNANTLLYCFEF